MPTAFVFINTEPASMPEVLKKIKAVEAVEEAGMVYGVFDIVAKGPTQLQHFLDVYHSCRIARCYVI